MEILSSKLSSRIRRRDILILLVVSTLSLGFYISSSAVYWRAGFPLDDAWIHLTYARNLIQYHEWVFLPGQPSAGSTAPIWSMLLSIGFLIHLGPYIWTFTLGAFILFSLALCMEYWARELLTTYRTTLPIIGLFFGLEWHLVWSAGSGMESSFHALIITLVLLLLTRPLHHPVTLGILCGLSLWIRPDGLTLLGPVLLTWFLGDHRISNLGKFLIGFGLIGGGYFLFNINIAGTPFPNTFYAKQAEYTAWQTQPAQNKIGFTVLQMLIGPFVLLIPGVILWLTRAIRLRHWGTISAMIWAVGYVVIYALRLPPYQHGRYLIPAMPIFFFWGLLGLGKFILENPSTRVMKFVKLGWLVSVTFVAIGFLWMGAKSYSQDVAFIETEMIETAKWVKRNIPPDALIAAHDIGALGYFDDHELLDLAGLVSPRVIPFIRDESRIADYLILEGVDYLVAFPSLYPDLVSRSTEVFSTKGFVAPEIGGENMSVYQWSGVDSK